jgi:hypothetical protein
LRLSAVRNGDWQLLEAKPAWEENSTWDCFIAFGWQGSDGERFLVAVNYSSTQAQCYLKLPFSEMSQKNYLLRDRLSEVVYKRDGDNLLEQGLYLDLPPWGYHVFEFTAPFPPEK